MSDYRQDPPPAELIEQLEYRDGCLYWKPEFLTKSRSDKALGHKDRGGYLVFNSVVGVNKRYPRHYKVHRLIYFICTGEWPNEIDHINGIPDDNRIENLRATTHSLNCANKGLFTRNNTGYAGVTKDKNGFRAWITIDGKRFSKGYYQNAEAAALARDLLAHWFYGDFAVYGLLDKEIKLKTA